jgi:uncharacterized membrane protein YqjE
MIHPLLHRLATQPGLFAEHAGGYAELAAIEAKSAVIALRRRALWAAAALLCAAAALMFSGVAVIVAAAVPAAQMPLPWLVAAVPLCAWAVAAACGWAAARSPADTPFVHLREQWAADMQLLRDVNRAS